MQSISSIVAGDKSDYSSVGAQNAPSEIVEEILHVTESSDELNAVYAAIETPGRWSAVERLGALALPPVLVPCSPTEGPPRMQTEAPARQRRSAMPTARCACPATEPAPAR